MFDWLKRLFKPGKVLSKEQEAAFDKAGGSSAVDGAKSNVRRSIFGKEQGFHCDRGHPILNGQRSEDCFDCHLIDLMLAERKGMGKKGKEYVTVGTLTVLNGFHRGQAYSLTLAEDVPMIVGADPDCDIVLSDERISRRHLSMIRRAGRTTIRDVNSLHHSAMRAEGELQWYVLDPEREYWFRDGCHLMLGDIEFLFRASDDQTLKMSAAAG